MKTSPNTFTHRGVLGPSGFTSLGKSATDGSSIVLAARDRYRGGVTDARGAAAVR